MSENADASKLYRTIWRWHFYAGLFCIPFIIVLSITGAIYLFKPQIDHASESGVRNLSATGNRQSPNTHIQAALDSLPAAKFHTYRLPASETDAIQISVFSNKQRYLVYVNPFTLEVMRTVAADSQFIEIVRSIHGELLAGKMGSILVELAACWAIILIITGVYLWWPKQVNSLGRMLYPRLGLGGRSFWKELHSVVGIWIALFTLFLLISGLPWALVWGSAFKEVRKLGEQLTAQDWSLNQQQQIQSWRALATTQFDLNRSVYEQAQTLQFAWPVDLSISDERNNIWKLSSQHQNRPLRENAWIDNSGQVIQRDNFSDKALMDKIIGVGIAAHEGQLFGWANQLLGVLTAIGLLTMSISGLILWLRRKPQGVLGAPPPIKQYKNGYAIVGFVLIPALFLPLVALSLLSMWLLEKLVLQHIPPVRHWLCLDY